MDREPIAQDALRRASWARLPTVWRLVLLCSLPGMAGLTALPVVLDGIPLAAALAATVATWLPLLAVRRHPIAVLWAITVVSAAYAAAVPRLADAAMQMTIASFQPIPVAVALASTVVGYSVGGARAWLHSAAAGLAIAVASSLSSTPVSDAHQVLFVNVILLGTGVGIALRSRIARDRRLAADRAALTERAVANERMRIARDIHDALAHRLTLVNAQASVAEFLAVSSPEKAREALAGISVQTQEALRDLRATLGVLRSDGSFDDQGRNLAHPVASVEALDALVEGFRNAGANVTLVERGERRTLADQASAGVYRIVQETLTNATKHAPGQPVAVTLVWSDAQVEVVVSNRMVPGGGSGPGTGHGLVGMRERAIAAGGRVAVRQVDSTYVVNAELPLATQEGE